MTHLRLIAIALLCTASLCGCSRPRMVVPTLFETGVVDPLADVPPPERSATHSVFYVTDRRFETKPGAGVSYGSKRSSTMDVGRFEVTFGKRLGWCGINACVDGARDRLPETHFDGIERFGVLDETQRPGPRPDQGVARPDAPDDAAANDRFILELNAALKRSPGKEITLYIHGFNTKFKNAAMTTAEYDLVTGGLGPFILYSWPSYESLFEYSHDRDAVRYTSGHARRLLEFLSGQINAGRLDAEQINLIAHSTGAEVAGSVLRELGLLSRHLAPEDRQDRWKIGSVSLVSPDVSLDVTRERLLKEDLRGVYQRLTVYSSAKDSALSYASNVLYRGVRIGSIREDDLVGSDRAWLADNTRVTIIDVDSRPYNGLLNHSHHRYSSAVASDIILNLRAELTPQERGLTRGPGQVIWQFAEDYDRRIIDAARKAYATPSEP